MKQPVDILFLEYTDGSTLECIIMEVCPEVTKLKAAVPDESLGKIGFFLEGDDYVVMEMDIISPN